MQPSSLIFLVIIAIWAAYLLQHWVRRREHLATARSVDRFSEAMRVLERRAPLSEGAAVPAPRSYDVSPARPARPEAAARQPQVPHQEPVRPLAAPAAPATVLHRRHIAGVPARRLRGLSFLGSLVLLLASLLLAGLGVLSWWTGLVALGLVLADLAWLRRAAELERVARRASLAGRGRGAAPAPRASRPAPAARTEPRAAAPTAPATQAAVAAPAAGEAAAAVEAPADGDEADRPAVDPDAWQPVPVPRPTYTMKARAAQPVAQPAPIPAPAMASSFGAVVADGELDGLLDRRQAAGA